MTNLKTTNLRANDEFVIRVSAEEDDDNVDLTLAPLDQEVVENRRRATLAELPPPPPPPPEPKPFRFNFTIKEIMIFTAAVAVALAVVRLMGGPAVAGLVAVIALLAIPFFHALPDALRKVWWGVFALYVLACLVAVLQR